MRPIASNKAAWIWFIALAAGFSTGCCAPLTPRSIPTDRLLLSEQLRDGSPQVQRGEKRKVIDAVGWVVGIPSKILLWNRRMDNHNISQRTEEVVTEYLAVNALDTTRVRINQYAPGDDWRRLVKNKRVAAPWRYTFGAVATLYETVLPGRLIGGDHYNPYTDTIHLYSDVPAIALHEAGMPRTLLAGNTKAPTQLYIAYRSCLYTMNRSPRGMHWLILKYRSIPLNNVKHTTCSIQPMAPTSAQPSVSEPRATPIRFTTAASSAATSGAAPSPPNYPQPKRASPGFISRRALARLPAGPPSSGRR